MARGNNRKRTKARDKKFFDSIAAGLGVIKSAQAACYSSTQIYVYRDEDEEFKSDWADATAEYVEVMEAEADRRAIEGVEEPVFYMGKSVGVVNKFSDSLLMFRLKKLDPTYRERHEVEHKGKVDNATPVINLTLNGGDKS